MTRIRFSILFLFVGLLAMAAFQFEMMDQKDLDCVSIVEEQQETFGQTIEVIGDRFRAPKFELYSKSLGEAFKKRYSIIHIDNDYPSVYLSVPYSPPELS